MPTIKTELEQRLYTALKRIAQYEDPECLRRNAGKWYGCDGDEAVGMAYENVIHEAKHAIKGVRLPRKPSATELEAALKAQEGGNG